MSADLIARLIKAGTPAELVAEVAMVLGEAKSAMEAIQKRRNSDRNRQAIRRACHVMSRDRFSGEGGPDQGPMSADGAEELADVTGHHAMSRESRDEGFPSLSPSAPTPITTLPDSLPGSARVEPWPWTYRDDFWRAYPHKIGRMHAIIALDRVKAVGVVRFGDLLAAVHRYAAKTDDRPWCNPATWLDEGRWDDDPAPPPQRAQAQPARQVVRNGNVAYLLRLEEQRRLRNG